MTLQEHIDAARKQAFAAAAATCTKQIQTNRRREKLLAEHGMKIPFGELILEDIQKQRESGDYAVLATVPEYASRVRALEAEQEMVSTTCNEAMDEAEKNARLQLPPELVLSERHLKERDMFMAQAQIADMKKAPPHLVTEWRALLKRQNDESQAEAQPNGAV